MSRFVRFTIPDHLAAQIDALRGGEDIQDWILATLRQAVRGQLNNEAEIQRLHETIRTFARQQPAQAPDLLDTLLGTTPPAVASRGEPQAQANDQPRKLRWG